MTKKLRMLLDSMEKIQHQITELLPKEFPEGAVVEDCHRNRGRVAKWQPYNLKYATVPVRSRGVIWPLEPRDLKVVKPDKKES